MTAAIRQIWTLCIECLDSRFDEVAGAPCPRCDNCGRVAASVRLRTAQKNRGRYDFGKPTANDRAWAKFEGGVGG